MIGQHTQPSKIGVHTPPTQKINMDSLISYILLLGVMLSVTLILAGLAWHWLLHGNLQIVYPISGMNLFQFISIELRLAGTDMLRPRLLVGIGISLLMLTPFVRVLASVIYFAIAERNLKYALFTAFVLAVLTYSLFLR